MDVLTWVVVEQHQADVSVSAQLFRLGQKCHLRGFVPTATIFSFPMTASQVLFLVPVLVTLLAALLEWL